MTAPTLFDMPLARATDPRPAHLAAAKVRPGNAALVKAIRAFLIENGPSTAFEIADALEGRWQHDSIRSACARAGLESYQGGETPRGNPCLCYYVAEAHVVVAGERL